MSSSVGRQIGFAQRVWRAVFGAPDEAEQALKEATSHGASLINLARAWSVPLLICFSIAAAIVLGRAPMEHNIARAQRGFGEGGALGAVMALNWFEMIELLVIIVFVFGADLAVLAAANNFRDGRSRGEKVKALFGHTVIIFGIGALEACTFTIMLASIENPQTLAQWAFVLFRSIGIPTVAVYLATLRRRRLTEDDSDALMEMKTSKRLIALIDSVDMEHADIGQLMNLRMLLAAKHLSKERRAEAIIEAINRLSPDVARAELEAERGRLRDAIENANTRAFQQLSSALLHLAATGSLPEWVTQQAPELAGLKFGSLGKGAGNRGAKAPPSLPRTRSEAIRYWLESIGVTLGKTPVGRKGIWIKSTDLAILTDARMSGEPATELAKRLGGETKISTAWALPFDKAMGDLYQRHMLSEGARIWWESFVASGGNEVDNGPALRVV